MTSDCWRQTAEIDRAEDRHEAAERIVKKAGDDRRVVEVIRNGSPNPRIEKRVDHCDTPLNAPIGRIQDEDDAQDLADELRESPFRVVFVYGSGEWLIEEVHD